MQLYWAETVMFIKVWQLIILYLDRMDWRAGHLTTTEGTGVGAFANKNCPNARGKPEGLPEGDAREWNWLARKWREGLRTVVEDTW